MASRKTKFAKQQKTHSSNKIRAGRRVLRFSYFILGSISRLSDVKRDLDVIRVHSTSLSSWGIASEAQILRLPFKRTLGSGSGGGAACKQNVFLRSQDVIFCVGTLLEHCIITRNLIFSFILTLLFLPSHVRIYTAYSVCVYV